MANQTKQNLRRILSNRLRKMINRCENPKQSDYVRYGARGISVCPEWLRKDSGLASFIKHVGSELPLPHGVSLEAALAMRGAAHVSLDRIDNDRGYEPGNVRWATPLQQSANQRRTVFVSLNGANVPRTEAARAAGVNPSTAAHRERLGYSRTDAVSLGPGGRTASTRRSARSTPAGDDQGWRPCRGRERVRIHQGHRWMATGAPWPEWGRKVSRSINHGAGPVRPSDTASTGREGRTIPLDCFSTPAWWRFFIIPFPIPNDYYEVDHINTDTQDDRPCNLRWRRPVEHRANAHQDRVRESSDAVNYRDPTLQASALRAVIAADSARQPSPSVVEEPPLPQNLDDLAVIQLAARREGRCWLRSKPLGTSTVPGPASGNPRVQRNNATCTDGEVYIDCKSQTGQVLRRVLVNRLTTSDRVFHGCLLCHRQSSAPPIEIRNRLRYPNKRCESCQALDLQRPDLAELIAPDPATGIKKDPSRITVGSNQFCHFRCRETRLYKRHSQEGEVIGAGRRTTYLRGVPETGQEL